MNDSGLANNADDDGLVVASTNGLASLTTEKSWQRSGMARNVVHLGLGQVGTTVLTIACGAAVARTLAVSDFGLMYLITSIATFAYVIVDWGHGPYIIREVARQPFRAGELLGSAIVLRGITVLLTCMLSMAITWLLGYDRRTYLLAGLMIITWLPAYVALSFGWVFRAGERMDRDAQLNVALKVATLLSAIACLALGGRVIGLMFSSGLAGLATCTLAIATYRSLHLPPIRATKSAARELLLGGAPMLAMSLAVAVEPYFNANILYKMASVEVVAWYAASWSVAGTLVAPAMILGATMYPRLSATASDAADFARALRTSFRPLLLLAVLAAAGTYIFAEVPVALIYGRQKYGPAADNLRAFAPVLLLLYVDIFFSHAILAVGGAGRLATAKVLAVPATIALELFLVPLCEARFGNGGLGVMYSMALSELMMLVTALWLIRDAIDRRMIGDIGRALLAGGATVWLMRQSVLTPFLAIPICVLMFVALSSAIGLLNRSDVALLMAGLRKRGAEL